MMVKKWSTLIGILTLLLGLTSCGGDDDSQQSDQEVDRVSLTGVAVKGPLATARVDVYRLDVDQTDLKGEWLVSATTGQDTFTDNLSLPTSIAGEVLLVSFSGNGSTIDINTGSAPIFDEFITVVEADDVLAGDSIYASPLTTLAIQLARLQGDATTPYAGDQNGTLTEAEFINAIDVATQQVLSTLGLGWSPQADLLNTPPLLVDSAASNDALLRILMCRQAIEGLAVIINDIASNLLEGQVTAQQVFDVFAQDLSDGVIDGYQGDALIALYTGVSISALQARVEQDVEDQLIPGTDVTVGDIEELLVAETETTQVSTATTSLTNGTVSADPERANVESDIDGDGIADRDESEVSAGMNWPVVPLRRYSF